MSTPLHIEDLRRAWEARDPELVRLVEQLAQQTDEEPETPVREGAPTFAAFLTEIRGEPFRRKSREEQKQIRIDRIKALEAPDAEAPLPERLKLHEILLKLWEDDGLFARSCLLKLIPSVPLTYGPWRALKRIFKEAEARDDTEVYGALAARFDAALAGGRHEVSGRTLAYLCRRAWRWLRGTATRLPAAYADAAVDVLAAYPEKTRWRETWVANHIFYHETGEYTRSRFTYRGQQNALKSRAYAELWQRSPRPLFSLLERARSETVRDFAVGALKTDFRGVLREVEPGWVARLVNVRSAKVDEFVVWILTNVPRFEQGAFRTLGLHDAVLKLFDSPADAARAYAADYARTHARDLPVPDLVRLANNKHPAVRKLAADLLQARDPRTEVGLDAWGELLETQHGHDLAAAVIRKSFGASELTPAWFAGRLFSPNAKAFQFTTTLLPHVHPRKALGAGFFQGLIDAIDDPDDAAAKRVAEFASAELANFDLDALDAGFLRRLLVRPLTWSTAAAWIHEGRLKAQTLGIDFLKTLAYHPAWEADAGVSEWKQSEKVWARRLEFDEGRSERVLAWLADPRRFSPADLGLDWLLELVTRAEPRYHNFAVDVLIRSFRPADFAPLPSLPPRVGEGGVGGPPAAGPVNLGGASFLFTGKMATMKREDAEKRVKAASGAVASSVTAKLYYLVIGDDGSPLFGHGKKGSKQIKAEELNASGANIKIISETAFLQMLAGAPQTVSADATLAGCERLWQMAVAAGPADAPLAAFARKYILRHHPDIAQAETARPVDPGAEVPPSFLTFERAEPLFFETRKPLREFALELAKWEFARWAPPMEEVVKLSESPFGDVRNFVAKALLADDAPEHRRYRIDPDVLTPAAVYRFCESADEGTRALGMKLIQRSPRLQLPEELFRLTESPDRNVRSFVVRSIWSLYRDRGITDNWKPYTPPSPTVGAAARKAAAEAAENRGTGAPARPDHLPAGHQSLGDFLRRMLFEIPPGRPEAVKTDEGEGPAVRLKPLPARRAKLGLIEVLRDLALEEADFARFALPPLEEFLRSRGLSEQAACLVAVTRIRHRWADLHSFAGGAAS